MTDNKILQIAQLYNLSFHTDWHVKFDSEEDFYVCVLIFVYQWLLLIIYCWHNKAKCLVTNRIFINQRRTCVIG